MKTFLKFLQKQDAKLIESYASRELHNLEDLMFDLQKEHEQIKENLKKVNHLLDLIEKHDIKPEKTEKEETSVEKWLDKLKNTFEKFHLLSKEKLSKEDIAVLQKEKGKLLALKHKLEEQHKHIHTLLAKTFTYLIDTQNKICEELTKGYDVAAISQKLVDHFGRKLEATMYEQGKNQLMEFLEKTFNINKIDAKTIFNILEKNHILYYQINYSNTYEFPTYQDVSEYESMTYMPTDGTWFIYA
ncbi:MAG TPA: hypothetical protein ENK67_01270 [Flavobacteriia bacterium]|nr:hypothetical protein [Flavobacteriia bacterium]